MRVLIVYPKMDLYGGAELLVVRLANYLTKNKIDNALLTTDIVPEIENDFIGTHIIKYPYRTVKNILKPLNLFRTLWLLHKGLRKNIKDFDIINVHNYPAELCIFPYHKPVVWMCNEPPEVHVRFDEEPKYSLRRFVIGAILDFDKYVVQHHIKNVVVADQFNEIRFRKLYGLNPHVINYGIDYDFFAQQARDREKKRAGQFTVLHVGMLTPLKNQMESIKTIEKLKNTIPGIKLILAGFGEGHYLLSLQKYIREKQLEEHVEFTGHLSREHLRDLYHTGEVLLHPIKSQGGWLSPFEALCAQMPIVVSSEMTASNLVKKENLGIVTDDFANAIVDIYEKPAKYNENALWRAEWVRNKLSWDNFCEKMLEVFSKALNDTIH
jgi:glycosyltransferase involved in cell wall biosynthesis